MSKCTCQVIRLKLLPVLNQPRLRKLLCLDARGLHPLGSNLTLQQAPMPRSFPASQDLGMGRFIPDGKLNFGPNWLNGFSVMSELVLSDNTANRPTSPGSSSRPCFGGLCGPLVFFRNESARLRDLMLPAFASRVRLCSPCEVPPAAATCILGSGTTRSHAEQGSSEQRHTWYTHMAQLIPWKLFRRGTSRHELSITEAHQACHQLTAQTRRCQFNRFESLESICCLGSGAGHLSRFSCCLCGRGRES